MAATIRPRTDDDLPALAKVLVEVHALDGYPVEGVDNPLALLTLSRAMGAWTAELDGQPVGHVALNEPGPDDAAPDLYETRFGPRKTAVLGRLFLAQRARGLGLARDLAIAAMNEASQRGRVPVLDVMQKDTSAIHLYRRLGWVSLGSFQHAFGMHLHEPAVAMAWTQEAEGNED